MPIIGSQRQLFDIPDDVTYLNAAYFTPQLRTRRAAGIAALDVSDAPWTIGADEFFGPVERLRGLFAELVGGDADGVAIVPSVSYGLGIAAANIEVGTGRTVVVLHDQFPSAIYPWRSALHRGGGEIRTVDLPDDAPWTKAVLDAIDDTTAVVSVPNCHWTDGCIGDLVTIGEAAREVGAALVVDASQSWGAVPFDVASIQPDFVVGAGYKWLLGPYSLNYLWVAPEHRNGIPLEETWVSRAGSDDFSRLVDYRDEYAPGARRFDFGERASFQLLPMAIASLEQVLAWGVNDIAEAIDPLTAAIEDQATSRGLRTVSRHARGPHLIGLRAEGGLPAGLAGSLAKEGVYVAVRGDSIRVSPYVYNDLSDVDRLFSVLDGVL
jgi:selenocysteine lyase/cysteine desulfurase